MVPSSVASSPNRADASPAVGLPRAKFRSGALTGVARSAPLTRPVPAGPLASRGTTRTYIAIDSKPAATSSRATVNGTWTRPSEARRK